MKLLIISLLTALGFPFFTDLAPKADHIPARPGIEDCTSLKTTQIYHKGYVEWNEVQTLDGLKFGDMVTLSRRDGRVNAKYFASGSVSSRFSSWKAGKNVVAVCSGAFTEGSSFFQKPVGLTIDDGQVINRVLDPKMDGLVIVYATGGIAVSDLDNKFLVLGGQDYVDLRSSFKYYSDIEKRVIYPLSYFLTWAQENRATVFQTQLLVYENEPQMVYEKARTEQANRRFLILARDFTGNLNHIIFNVCASEYLGDATHSVFDLLRQKLGYDVIAMLNLDTGAKDHFQFYNDLGGKQPVCQGGQSISECSNLIAYYFE
ncbi:MAG: hypothetical protein H6581_09460 [Bacteroidia bacterium]|nr:hypothetical protein [Bacteroidia bacterium]